MTLCSLCSNNVSCDACVNTLKLPPLCTVCKDGYYLSGTTCNVCLANCQTCENGTTCKICKDINKVISPNCANCKPTFYYNTDLLICTNCMS